MSTIKIRAKESKGAVTVKALMKHPMETGQRKDKKTGGKIPAHFIQEVVGKANGDEVIIVHWGPAVSKNPYLTFASMLMAGIDGIKNKIDPGKSFDDDLYSLSEDQVKKLPTVCGSLREAMQNLDEDRKFLTEGGVFTDDQIDAYIELKFQEIYKFEHTPHPIEFEMYYSS